MRKLIGVSITAVLLATSSYAAQQVINNGDTYLQVRTKINANDAELYAADAALGDAAALDVGTSAGTVAAGDDSRFSATTNATLTTPNISGKIDADAGAVNDDDCTGEQGLFWYDDTDSAFEFCNANSGAPAVLGGGGYTNLTSFVDQTAWRVFYSNTDGDVTELALGADGTYLMSNGPAVAPTFETPAGSGDVTGVGDCTGGACLDGTSDGGTYARIYDGDSHYMQLDVENVAANYTLSLPPTIGTSGQLLQSDADNTTSWTSTLSSVSVDLGAIGNAVAVTDGDGVVGESASITTTELGYLNGLTGTTGTGSLVASASPTFTGTVGAASMVATGTINGLVEVTLDTAPTASPTCDGEWRINNDADVIDYTLPGAAAGLTCCFYAPSTDVVTVDVADGVDTITLDGTVLTAGYAIDSSGTAGDFACLMGIDATRWLVLGKSGTWVDGGAD